jgi:glycosyltransferase involved in cell wall biosynthesis
MNLSVSILLATFNGASFLKDQIESILVQDYNDWLLFVSDDGSVDGTIKIIEEYRKKYKDKIILIKNTHCYGNARDNFFNLLLNVSGELFFFCDQDDCWEKNKLSNLIEAYSALSENEKKKPILIHSDLMVVDENMNMLAKSFFKLSNINPYKDKLRNIIVQNIVTGCTMMINKQLKDMIFPYKDLNKQIIMHDWFCALVASAFGKIICINKPLVKYRQHNNNSIGAKNVREIKYLLNRIKSSSIIKANIESTQKQAEIFCRMYESKLSFTDRKVINGYASIKKLIKICRIFFIVRNSFLKNSLFRIIEQIIYI